MRSPDAGVAFVVLALGLASSLDACLTHDRVVVSGLLRPEPRDGPVAAAFGAPLPYARFAYLSLTYVVMPHVVLLDIVLLAAAIGAPMLALAWCLPVLRARRMHALALRLGRRCWSSAWWGAMLCAGLYLPVMSIGDSAHHRYGELRPAGLATHWHSYCEP